jgi:ribonuclease HI
VQNLALVQAIDKAIAERSGPVSFTWVRGHQGDRFNERADELAGIAARDMRDGRVAPANAVTEVIPVVVAAAPSRVAVEDTLF